jgi:hypothetical protein
MKLRNLKMNESISKQFEHALEDEHTILEPTEANALEVEEKREEQIKDDFKEQDKIADEVAKDTNATEVNEPKKVKDRKELSKLLAEAKEAGKQFKISRCNEEGYRYLFETIETEENKEVLNEKKGTKYIFFGVDKDDNEVVKKEFVDVNGVIKELKIERNKLFDDDKVDTVYVSEISETGEEKPIDRYMISREEFIKGESLEEENGDPSLDEKLPETFEGKMDFLAADEEEAIEGYDKVLLALEEGDPVREQLEKIRDEEVAHKEFLEKVKSDKNAIYKAPSEAEEVKDAVDLDEKCKENLEESKLEESDEPAAESIENCQKWVDYDMEHYGDVSKNTQEIIEKAGYQLIKDDHGDYEVAARDYEESLTEETNMEKINRALASLDMKEDLGEDDHFDFTSELYDEMRAVLKKYADKGVTKDDLSAALSFIDVHMDDDDELEFLDKNEIESKSKPVEVVDEEKTEEVTEESLEESVIKKFNKKWIEDKDGDIIEVRVGEKSIKKGDKVGDDFVTGFNPETNTIYLDEDPEVDGGRDYDVETVLSFLEEKSLSEEDERPFEEEKVEYEIDDEFDWKY